MRGPTLPVLACVAHTISAMRISTIRSTTRFEETVGKFNKFVSIAAPVQTPAAALEFVKAHSDAKARHNCFAWRLADGSTRTNGDGEPGGTAGPPILAAITGQGLHDVAILVARYRLGGGQKLGTGGLVRAYGGAAARCLELASVVEFEPQVVGRVAYSAEDTGVVFGLLGAFSPTMVDACVLEFLAPSEEIERLSAALLGATQGRVRAVLASEEELDGTHGQARTG